MRKIILMLALSLLAGFAGAQSTTISSTGVVDTDGFTWAAGTYQIQFVPSQANPNPSAYTWTGGALSQSFSGSLDGSGAFSKSIPSSTSIFPTNSQWQFTICPNARSGCFQFVTSVTGGSLDLTSSLNAVAFGPRFPYSSPSFGYGPIEVSSKVLAGSIFYNTTTSGCQIYSGSAWGNCATGGSGTPGGTNGQVQYNNSGSFGGFTASGDLTFNTATGVGTVKGINGQLLSALASCVLFNTTATGVPSCASAAQIVAGIGSAAVQKATDLASYPAACSGGQFSQGLSSGSNNCATPAGSGTVTSSGSPVSGNIPKFTTATNIAPAAASDIVSLFSSCSGVQYLGADGACHAAAGGFAWNSVQAITSNTPAVNWSTSNSAIVTANGGNPTISFTGSPSNGAPYYLDICNDGTIRTWSVPGNLQCYTLPIAVSECTGYVQFIYDGTNFVGPRSTITATTIYGTERSTPQASISGQFICHWNSTTHQMTCSDNGTNTGNMITPLASQTAHNWVQRIDNTGLQVSAQPGFGDLSGTATAAQLPVGTVITSTPVIGSSDTVQCSAANGSFTAFTTTISRPAFTQTAGAKWRLEANMSLASTATALTFQLEVEDSGVSGGHVIYVGTAGSNVSITSTALGLDSILDEQATVVTASGTLTAVSVGVFGPAAVINSYNTITPQSYDTTAAGTLTILLKCNAGTASNSMTINTLTLTKIY